MQQQSVLLTSQPEEYKNEYMKSVKKFHQGPTRPFWEEDLPLGGTNEVLQSHGVNIFRNAGKYPDDSTANMSGSKNAGQGINLMTKVTSCHDIWMSNQYNTPEWKPIMYQSLYTVDFNNKYI